MDLIFWDFQFTLRFAAEILISRKEFWLCWELEASPSEIVHYGRLPVSLVMSVIACWEEKQDIRAFWITRKWSFSTDMITRSQTRMKENSSGGRKKIRFDITPGKDYRF